MTSDPSFERRLTRLENDRDSLYDLVRVFRVETRAQFAKINRILDRIDGRLDKHDTRLDQHDARFDQHDARFDQHDARFDRIDARLDHHDARFDKVDGTLAEILRRLPESA